MDTSVLISIAGLASTVVASAIGFYYTHKAQRSPLRQELYKKQIEILTAFVLVATRMQMVADTLRGKASLSKVEHNSAQQLWHDLSGELLEVTQKGGVVLPASAYSAMSAVRVAVQDFEEVMVKDVDAKDAYFGLMGAVAHVFMIGREVVGADALSIESIRLHGAEGYEDMSRIGRHALAKVTAAMWSKPKYVDEQRPQA